MTNPATRDPTVLASAYATLHDLSNGRMAMGIGRGDSAVRYIGRQPMKVAEFERACAMVHEFMNGREVTWNDKQLQLKWVREELPPIPMWIAGYGPKALAAAGAKPQRPLWAGAIAATAAFLLHSGFDFLWQVPAIPLTVGALAGLAVPSAISQRNTPADSDSPTKGPTEICDVTYPSRPFWPESQSPVGPP